MNESFNDDDDEDDDDDNHVENTRTYGSSLI